MAGVSSGSLPQRVIYRPHGYKVEELIGSGTFSEVFKATHEESNSVIALKSFKHSKKTKANYQAAAKEIAILEIVTHPNILELKMYEVIKPYVYIGIEFAAHGSLRSYLKSKDTVGEPVIKHVMQQLIAALSYLHEMGVFHGDIKPENLLCTSLTKNGPNIKLCDFGLTEIKLKGKDNMIFTAGSFFYMAPEVLLKRYVDCTCDLWSAGIIMYSMMYNRNIFRIPEKNREMRESCMKRRVQPNWNGAENFSCECNSLVHNLLRYDKENRLSGKYLRDHPFLQLSIPAIPSAKTFLLEASMNIDIAFTRSRERKWGDALVMGIKSIMQLKIYYNLSHDVNSPSILLNKLVEYEKFTDEMEKILLAPDMELTCPEDCSDKELRKYLASTPKLLDGFDIGCTAEMFLEEGKVSRAADLYIQALELLVPLLQSEPKSNRKEILGRKVKKWLQDAEAAAGQKPADPAEAATRYTAQTPMPSYGDNSSNP